jgi:hypothetical protein
MTKRYEPFGPKYVVQWQTEFDADMTPQAAAIEAMREMAAGEVSAHVIDCETNRQWDVRFRDHVLEVIETRECRYDEASDTMKLVPLRKFDEVLQEFVPVEED